MTRIIFKLLFLFSISLFLSCDKAGLGGNASISVFPQHHEVPIKNGVVYIKYHANDLPGTDPSDFDDQATIQNDHAHFSGLKKGKYYLFHIGYDSLFKSNVRGGIAIEIKKETETKVIIPVTE